LWEAKTRKVWKVLTGHTSTTQQVAFAPDGKTLASTSGDTILLWNLATGQEVYSLTGEGVRFSPDGGALAGTHQSGAFIWSAPTFEEIARHEAASRAANTPLVFSEE
jgi:WD40 repeat protein